MFDFTPTLLFFCFFPPDISGYVNLINITLNSHPPQNNTFRSIFSTSTDNRSSQSYNSKDVLINNEQWTELVNELGLVNFISKHNSHSCTKKQTKNRNALLQWIDGCLQQITKQ